MHVGREGVTAKELVDLVCKLRLADWESSKNKRSHVSGVINKESRFVRVGTFKYTLRCFPGVVEMKPREASGALAAVACRPLPQALAPAPKLGCRREGLRARRITSPPAVPSF